MTGSDALLEGDDGAGEGVRMRAKRKWAQPTFACWLQRFGRARWEFSEIAEHTHSS